jgi:queuosine precursor transporter
VNGRRIGIAGAMGLVASVVVANWAIGRFGLVPVAPGLVAPAGVYAAGLAFGLRDVVHDELGRSAVLGCIAVGGALSLLVAPVFAVASAAAFVCSEIADLLVYERFEQRQWMAAAAASNVVGTCVDSALFLWLAFGSLDHLNGQVVGKLWMGALGVALVAGVRVARRRTADVAFT